MSLPPEKTAQGSRRADYKIGGYTYELRTEH